MAAFRKEEVGSRDQRTSDRERNTHTEMVSECQLKEPQKVGRSRRPLAGSLHPGERADCRKSREVLQVIGRH